MATGRILLVDDDPVLRSHLRVCFEDAGYVVDCAADGAQALTCCLAQPYAAVVTDLAMPHSDGFVLLHGLRQVAGTKPPCIVITAETDPAVLARVMDAGAFRVISKPLTGERLLSVLARATSPQRDQAATMPPDP